MRRGFTLSEVLVAIAILAAITSITVPLVVSTADYNNSVMYKSAFRIVEDVTREAVEDWQNFPTGSLSNTSKAFCNKFKASVNTIDTPPAGVTVAGCDGASDISASISTFITTNGMSWYFIENDFIDEGTGDSHNYLKIQVDLDGPLKGKNALDYDIFGIMIRDDGKITHENPTDNTVPEARFLLN